MNIGLRVAQQAANQVGKKRPVVQPTAPPLFGNIPRKVAQPVTLQQNWQRVPQPGRSIYGQPNYTLRPTVGLPMTGPQLQGSINFPAPRPDFTMQRPVIQQTKLPVNLFTSDTSRPPLPPPRPRYIPEYGNYPPLLRAIYSTYDMLYRRDERGNPIPNSNY